MMIIWCMFPEISGITERIFCPFTPLTTRKIKILKNEKNSWRYHFKHEYHTWKSHDVWFLRYGAWQNFFSFWAIFCPFTPPSPHPNNPDNQNVEKAPGDIIILNKCTINDNHKIYGSWDIKCTRQNVFVILGHYLPYYPFNSLKNENFKKMKKKTSGDIIILHMCTKNHDHMLFCSWDMACDRCNCYFSFWPIFCPFIPRLLRPQKMKSSKKWK